MLRTIFRPGRLALAAMLIGLLALAGAAGAAEYWLRAEATQMAMPDGQSIPMWGYALTDATFGPGTVQIPGPELTVTPGEPLTIHLKNNLPEPTSIIVPGQVPDSMTPVRFAGGVFDGRIRSFTAEADPNGGTQTYTWSTFRSGTFLYQSGSHPGIQVPMGLYGAVKGDAAAGEAYPGATYDSAATLLFSEIDPAQHAAVAGGTYGTADYPSTLVVGYHPKYFLINGASYSTAAPPPAIPVTGTTLLRFLNAGLRGRIPVVHGNYVSVIAEDGNARPFPRTQTSLDLHPGMTIDALLQPASAGPIPVYDRALGLSNAGLPAGGMYAWLDATTNLVLRQPNGGETLYSGTVYSIQWTAIPPAASYELHYSLDNGASWILIAQPASGSSFDWTIPDVTDLQPTSLVRVNALDAAGALVATDMSDAPFTIAPVPVQLLSPNGGETLSSGTTHSIQWGAATGAAGYRLEYSLDNGGSWNLIGDAGATTSFDWTVPDITAPQAASLVQVTALDAAGATLSVDQSDATFTIAPVPVRVTSPNGGETLISGTVHAVQWTAATGASNYRLEYSLDNGTNWTLIEQVSAVTSLDWTIPAVIAPQVASLVQVTALDAAGATLSVDRSDATFTIAPVPVQVISPNGGESLTADSVHVIQWTAADGATGYRLEYSLDGGTGWTLIGEVGAVTSHDWTVPVVTATQANALVQVTALNAGGTSLSSDRSDVPFTIAPAAFAVLAPNGGETLVSGTVYSIRWNAFAGAANYRLYYSLNNGATWNLFREVGGTATSTNWTVINVTTPQANCLIRVRARNAAGSTLAIDNSDATFVITPALAVLAPNGGETLTSGTSSTIQWTAFGGAANYALHYSTDGTTWTFIQQVGTVTSYSWTVPAVATAQSNSRVRVTALNVAGTPLAIDQSNGPFTIMDAASAPFAVVSPNGGERLVSGTVHTIRWNALAGAANYRLYYSLNNGSTWNLFRQVGGTATSTDWNVLSVTSEQPNCLLRVRARNAAGATLAVDNSDGTFTIAPAAQAAPASAGKKK